MSPWILPVGFLGILTAQEPSTFRVNTRLVEVDVVVRSKDRAVTGLAQNDFRILDNGKPQNIATFSVKSSESKVTANPAPLPSGVISNRVSPRGEEPVAATVILLDRLNTAVKDQSYFGKELLKYLKTLQPGEHVAIYSLLKSLRIVQDFTDDPRRLLEAASHSGAQQSVSLAASDESALKAEEDSIRFAVDPNDTNSAAAAAFSAELAMNAVTEMEDAEKKNRALLTSVALEDVARHLRGLPGRKKLVWVSGGFPIGALEVNSRHDDEFGTETAHAVRALNNANVAVYAIDPRGVVASGTNPAILTPNAVTGQSMFSQIQRPDPVGLNAPNIAAMNLFASGTGGRAIYVTNDLVGALKTVMEDDEVVYTLGFYPSEQKLDGSYHSLSVKVARKGVEVHHRQGYLASDTKVYTPRQRREAMTDAVQNPLDSTELGLRASIAAVSGQPGAYQLAVTLNVNELHLEHQKNRWVGNIDFGTHFSLALDFKGTYETIRISLTEDRLRETLNKGFILRRKIDSGGANGVLRVVVQDRATGSIGSMRIPIGTE
ncbi:MAG: VWA domain-containing protein [Acidobacteriia bacterium]|nr:VWA domain-containing protein [Terriglobia bacterium]